MSDKNNENKQGGPTDRQRKDTIEVNVEGKQVKIETINGEAPVEDVIRAAGESPDKYNLGILGTSGVYKPGQKIKLISGAKLVLLKKERTTVTETQGVQRAAEELQGMGFMVKQRIPVANAEIVVIPYTIPLGKHSGREIDIGLEVPITYNANPPHWVHMPQDIVLPRGNQQDQPPAKRVSQMEGCMKWSRGPEDQWNPDTSIRTMEWYVNRHLTTLWEEQCYAA